MSDLKVQGRLCEVFPEQAVTDSFRSRNFVIETDGQYPQFVQFQLVQDRCGIVDSHRIGHLVTVHFDLRGKKWQGKYITNLNAWKIEGQGTPQQTRMPAPDAVGNAAQPIQTTVTASTAADVPFPPADTVRVPIGKTTITDGVSNDMPADDSDLPF